jgi:hypothetical protein
MNLTARKHFGERMADEFADAQLTLRRAGGIFAVMMARHNNLTQRHHPRKRVIQ